MSDKEMMPSNEALAEAIKQIKQPHIYNKFSQRHMTDVIVEAAENWHSYITAAPVDLEALKNEFVASIIWSSYANERDKTLVLGNLNAFVAFASGKLRGNG